MGIGPNHSKCNCIPDPVKIKTYPNPNPKDFKVLKYEHIGDYTICMIKYNGCVNYEGQKILVYEGLDNSIYSFDKLDPHFCDDPKCISPIARFVPTDDGWKMAVKLVKLLQSGL